LLGAFATRFSGRRLKMHEVLYSFLYDVLKCPTEPYVEKTLLNDPRGPFSSLHKINRIMSNESNTTKDSREVFSHANEIESARISTQLTKEKRKTNDFT
jgi:hypothetical protein